QPAAHVDELLDARLFHQVAHGAVEEQPVPPGDVHDLRQDLQRPQRQLTVDGEVVLAAEQPAVGTGRRRLVQGNLYVDLLVRCHGASRPPFARLLPRVDFSAWKTTRVPAEGIGRRHS